jgi:hypothetical protein
LSNAVRSLSTRRWQADVGVGFERCVVHELQARRDEVRPRPGEPPAQRDRDHAVVVDADADAQASDLRHIEHGAVEGEGRLLILDVGRRGGLGRQLRRAGGLAQDAGDAIERDRIGDLEQIERGEMTVANHKCLVLSRTEVLLHKCPCQPPQASPVNRAHPAHPAHPR